MDKEYDLQDIGTFFKKRKKILILTFLSLFLLGFIVAVVLPPIYESEAMIRIEDQQIPEDFVQPSINDYAEERIEKISQQVMSRDKLLEIMDGLDLYPEIKAKNSPTEMAKKMRGDIEIETLVAEFDNKNLGRNMAVTFAFKLSYQGKDPEKVYKVTDTISKLFLEEDFRSRNRLVSGTTVFFEEELRRLEKGINHHERKITEFKKKHVKELPSDSGYNLQILAGLERDLDNAEMRLRLLEDKKNILEAQLMNTEPLTPIVIDGKTFASSPDERLKGLRLELARMRSVYSEKHPDIKKLKREIRKLEAANQNSADSVEKVKRLNELEIQLASATSEYGAEHPDVKAIKNEIALLEKDIDGSISETAKIKISEEKPDNPVYLNLSAQIKSINFEIKEIKNDREELISKIQESRRIIEINPVLENELNVLNRDYEDLKEKYSEVSNKLMNAQIVKEMEGKKKGGNLVIVSPAYLPTEPTKPNRLIILILGFLGAIGISSSLAVFQEKIDGSIRTAEQIKLLTGLPVLTSISYFKTTHEKRSDRLKKLGGFLIAIISVGAILYFVDQYFIKLSDMWVIFIDRMKLFA
jgi:uncharacterized protein involved in exopolysaccharide biosynthesis